MPDPIGGSASAEPEGIDHEDFREPAAPGYEADVLMASAEGSGDVPASDTKKKNGQKAAEKKKSATKSSEGGGGKGSTRVLWSPRPRDIAGPQSRLLQRVRQLLDGRTFMVLSLIPI